VISGLQVIFLLLAVLTIGSAIMMVISRKIMHAALWLIASFLGVAGVFATLESSFFAIVQIVVYIGAIAILIIFAVMLTRSMTSMRELFNRQWWASAIVAVLLFGLLVLGVIGPVWVQNEEASQPVSDLVATTQDLGVALVDGNQYVLPFELASLLLTAAMIGAIVIAREDD